MRRLFLLGLLLCCVLPLWATHQRAAEITYRCLGGNTYEFTLTCYTYSPSPAGMERDSLAVLWGDGFGDMMPRLVYQDLGENYTLNIYKMTHTYAAAGTYSISMEDPNRNYGVVNVPNSVSIPMYIESELVINPFLGPNNSVQLLNAPVDQGCVGKPFYHNPGAYDPDGDSLSYRLVPCKGTGGEDIPGYQYPRTSSVFDIDPVTGLLQWEAPVQQGEYNVAILIEEWRQGVKVGSVIRDMQVLVNACDNQLPVIAAIDDTCVMAGSRLELLFAAMDPDGDQVTLEATGAPFELPYDTAVLTPPTAYGYQPSLSFVWNTNCSHVRRQPYQVTIRAKDNGIPVSLTNVHTFSIHVIAPAVEGLQAEWNGGTAHLTWSPYSACPNVTAIRVYRKTGANPYEPDFCETGVRPGYRKVADLAPGATAFDDTNGGVEFSQGVDYCYRVVAVYPGDAESQPSGEVCLHTRNDQPLMTMVSNDSLDLASGRMRVRWVAPKDIEPYYTSPYSYRLIRYYNGVTNTLYDGMETAFLDQEIDLSEAASLRYEVEMRDANEQQMGKSAPADALLLSGTVGDRVASLHWAEAVPWVLDSTEVFRSEDTVFVKVAVTTEAYYRDTLVENDVTYRYYVRSFGHYALETVPRPLVNYSAILPLKPTAEEEPEGPEYELPNAFTPNGDGVNDVFVPMRITPDLITKVNMHIFNRWGRPVYDTEDVFINWDGRAQGTRMECPTGTYFYVCDVEMKTPEGPVNKRLQGIITLLR
jgi:gliding motility-associated-like protein